MVNIIKAFTNIIDQGPKICSVVIGPKTISEQSLNSKNSSNRRTTFLIPLLNKVYLLLVHFSKQILIGHSGQRHDIDI